MPSKTKDGFSAEEKAAMQERARETRRGRSTPQGEAQEVLDKIAEMTGTDRAMAERVHAIIAASAPELAPKTWYGMPAYAKNGAVVCFFQAAAKFKVRYATLGFSDKAALDDGAMWATAFALAEMTPEVEQRIAALVRQAAG